MLTGLLLNDLQAVGEILGEIAALEVGHIATRHFLHRRLDALEGLDGLQFMGERCGVGALVIVENRGDAAFGNWQHAQQLLELFVHLYQQFRCLVSPLFIEQAFFGIDHTFVPATPKGIETGRMEQRIAVSQTHFIIALQQLDRHPEQLFDGRSQRFFLVCLLDGNTEIWLIA